MNKELLSDLFPEHFRVQKIKGILFYGLGVLFGLLASLQVAIAVSCILMSVENSFLQSLTGVLLNGFISWIWWKAGEEALDPYEKSKAIHSIQTAKDLFDEGLLDLAYEPDPANVSVDYSDYTLFTLVEVYQYLDKTTYPDNHQSLVAHLRRRMNVLIERRAFG